MSNNPLLNNLLVEQSYEVDLYDMSIEDVEERKKKKLRFKSAMSAANYLGIVPKRIYRLIGAGKYAHQKSTDKKFAVRKAKV